MYVNVQCAMQKYLASWPPIENDFRRYLLILSRMSKLFAKQLIGVTVEMSRDKGGILNTRAFL